MPSTLPSSRSKDTSFNAQIMEVLVAPRMLCPRKARKTRTGVMSVSTITSRNILYWNFCCAAPILYCLPRFFTLMAVVMLDGIRESLFHIAEVEQSTNHDE